MNNRETLFEIQRRQPLIIRVKVLKIDRMRILFVAFDKFDDLMLNVVEGLRIGRWAILGSPVGAIDRQVQIVRDAVYVEIEKYLGGRPIRMLGLAQQT